MSNILFNEVTALITFVFLLLFIIMPGAYTLLDLASYWGFLHKKLDPIFQRKREKVFESWLKKTGLEDKIPYFKNALIKSNYSPSEFAGSYKEKLEVLITSCIKKETISVGLTQTVKVKNFINLRGACLIPNEAEKAAKIMVEFIYDELKMHSDLQFDAIAVLKETNPFLGFKCAELLRFPCISLNKKTTLHGEHEELLIDAFSTTNIKDIILIDDSITTGYHFLSAVEALKKNNFNIKHGFFLFVRKELSVVDTLKKANITPHYIFELNDQDIDLIIEKHKH